MRAIVHFLFVIVAFISLSAEAAASYRSELRKATKTGRLYSVDNFEAKLIWDATFVTDHYRRARAKEHIRLLKLSPLEAARYFAEEETKQQEETEVIVSLYSRKDYEHFSSDAETFWHIVLETDEGQKLSPLEVAEFPVSPYQKKLYPHVNRWSNVYRVIFPKGQMNEKVKIMLWSVVGESTLQWRHP
ncbi:MAG: hypothetical protein A3I05_04545 [Deltaproteobacteria bacterium RIFCSPLOWO2_02_FULL_44_10]|nr:MAG: hypothetical protein A3C46_07350 [Deltaproteobacteria bacterium RIFCSPHIGHO2_02_FULL_44_16]OGQ46626.1 MAG: hypothetical protein A3I05_04545 [Deltaproteobacteria bacterium RIFCSPLOWO2_02_FULL_44_10]